MDGIQTVREQTAAMEDLTTQIENNAAMLRSARALVEKQRQEYQLLREEYINLWSLSRAAETVLRSRQ